MGPGSFWEPVGEGSSEAGPIVDGRVQKYVLAVIDLDAETPEAQLIAIDFLGHGVSRDPTQPEIVTLFEKKGPGACQVDLARGEYLRPVRTNAAQHFYGHGAYSQDGALLYATESVLDDGHRGVLMVRDAKTLDVLGELPTWGTSPHDCVLLDDGCTMVVANGGGLLDGGAMPSVTYVDVNSEMVLDRIELTNPRFNAGHLALTAAGDLAVVSAPRDGMPNLSTQLGAVTLVSQGEAPRTMTKPTKVVERMRGETLSVAIHEPSSLVMATHPEGDMVTMWDLHSGALKGVIDAFTEPRGVVLTLDGERFIVSHRRDNSVCLSAVSTDTLELEAMAWIDPSYTSGSHLFIEDLVDTLSA